MQEKSISVTERLLLFEPPGLFYLPCSNFQPKLYQAQAKELPTFTLA